VDTLPVLQTALVRRVRVRVRYDSYAEGKVIDVTLRPYRIAYIHRGWYLIAFCERDREVRTFKIERILQLKVMRRSYRIDPEFNLDDYFGNAWVMIRGDDEYHVKIRFSKKVAANVDEIIWHKTQQTRFEEDGSLIFEVDVDGIEEISWWVLGYGAEAKVLEPPKLRKLVARHAARVCEHYRNDSPDESGKRR
jgi:predicted DNA-binding transcriptional regulator YafY